MKTTCDRCGYKQEHFCIPKGHTVDKWVKQWTYRHGGNQGPGFDAKAECSCGWSASTDGSDPDVDDQILKHLEGV